MDETVISIRDDECIPFAVHVLCDRVGHPLLHTSTDWKRARRQRYERFVETRDVARLDLQRSAYLLLTINSDVVAALTRVFSRALITVMSA